MGNETQDMLSLEQLLNDSIAEWEKQLRYNLRRVQDYSGAINAHPQQKKDEAVEAAKKHRQEHTAHISRLRLLVGEEAYGNIIAKAPRAGNATVEELLPQQEYVWNLQSSRNLQLAAEYRAAILEYEMSQDHQEATLHKARLEQMRHLSMAIDIADHYLGKISEEHIQAIYERAEVCIELSQFKGAEDDLMVLIDSRDARAVPYKGKSCLLRGILDFRKSGLDEQNRGTRLTNATTWLLRALEILPDDAYAERGIANAYIGYAAHQQGYTAQAVSDLTKAKNLLETADKDPKARAELKKVQPLLAELQQQAEPAANKH